MQADRPEALRQVVRNAPLRLKLAWESLEAAGFRIAGNSEDLDSQHIVIECLPPLELRDSMTGNNPRYMEIMQEQVERALQALKWFAGVKVKPFGWRLTIWLPTPERDANFSKSPGRPPGNRSTETAAIEAQKLRAAGCTFREIEKKLGDRFGHRDPGSWQKLVRRHFPAPR